VGMIPSAERELEAAMATGTGVSLEGLLEAGLISCTGPWT